MFERKGLFSTIGRPAIMAAMSAVVLTSVGPAPALAEPAASGKGQAATSAATQSRGATDFSARRRVYRGSAGGAAAAAAFASIVGTGIAIAAAQNRRAYYDDYYGGGPVYYGGGPYAYYGGGPYYGGYGGYRSGVPYVNGHPLANW